MYPDLYPLDINSTPNPLIMVAIRAVFICHKCSPECPMISIFSWFLFLKPVLFTAFFHWDATLPPAINTLDLPSLEHSPNYLLNP